MAASILGVDPTVSHSTKAFALGTVAWDNLGRAFVYVEADAALTAGMCCIIHGDFGAQGITTTLAAVDAGLGKLCGVAMAAVASGSFGWLAVFGTGSDILVNLNAAADDFERLRPTTTAGALDDTTTATEPYVEGLVVTTASGGAEQEVAILCWPHVSIDLII